MDDEVPATARRLESKAREAGWIVTTTCTSGAIKGRELRSVAVRLTRGDERLVGLWEEGSFRCGLRLSPFGRLSSRELTALVEAETEADRQARIDNHYGYCTLPPLHDGPCGPVPHTPYVCPGGHDDGGWSCQYCAGGLVFCTVCKEAEGGLAESCPGAPEATS